MAEVETKPATPAKAKGWDRTVRHLGTFVDFRKREWPAYLEFQDDGEAKRGFAIFCTHTHKEFKPGLLVTKPEHLKMAKADFRFSGKTEPMGKEKSKPISKARRNALVAADMPKAEEAE